MLQTRLLPLLSSHFRQPLIHFARQKGFIRPHRKQRWLPRAKTKMFLLPPKDHTPPEELEQIMELKMAHHDQIAALTQYLWEDFLKNSDVGEAAKEEAAREQQEHEQRVAENEMVNTMVAERRAARIEQEAKEEEAFIRAEVERELEVERERQRVAAEKVAMEKEELQHRVKSEEDLERAIMAALDDPVDFEYAIDKQGHIYRGRYTKSCEVPLKEREAIPVPTTEAQLILEGNRGLART